MTVQGADGHSTRGRTLNVSQGGLCADVDAQVPNGSVVSASLTLVFADDVFSEPLAITARVVWATVIGDRTQIGLSFIHLTDEQRHFLDLFIRYLSDEGYDPSAA